MRGNLSDDGWTILIALLGLFFIAEKFGPRLMRRRHADSQSIRPEKPRGPILTAHTLR